MNHKDFEAVRGTVAQVVGATIHQLADFLRTVEGRLGTNVGESSDPQSTSKPPRKEGRSQKHHQPTASEVLIMKALKSIEFPTTMSRVELQRLTGMPFEPLMVSLRMLVHHRIVYSATGPEGKTRYALTSRGRSKCPTE